MLGLWQVERELGPQAEFMSDDPEFDLICKIIKNRKGPKLSMWRLDLDPRTLRIGKGAERFDPDDNKRSF